MCGFIEAGLVGVFAAELEGLGRERVRGASVFYTYFAAPGPDIVLEEAASWGRIGMAVRTPQQVWLFEFEVTETAPTGGGMQQLRNRGYADKYRAPQPAHPAHSHRIRPRSPQHRPLRNSRRIERDLTAERPDSFSDA